MSGLKQPGCAQVGPAIPAASSAAVMLVSSHARRGGSERYAETLAKALYGSWISETVCLEDGPLVESLRKGGGSVAVLQTGPRGVNVLASAWRLRALIRRSRPQVVHASGVKAALTCALATLFLDVALVWTKHDFSFDGNLARVVGSRCDRIIAVSRAVTTTFRSRTLARVRVIYNGIVLESPDREQARRGLRQALGVGPADPLVALVGRLDPHKGHLEALAAAPAVLERIPTARFVFVGPMDPAHPTYPETLRGRIADEGLEGSVFTLPYTDEVVELIAACDVLVVPSVADPDGRGPESFSLVALEALIVGTPVVAYEHGGLPELVGDCGRLVPPGERTQLADALIELLTDDDLREKLSRAGVARASAEFGFDTMLRKTTEVYSELLPMRWDAMSQRRRS
jgi:glycosyltransferase involved in cell wall biosynthesis